MVRSPEGPDLVQSGVVSPAPLATFLVAGSCWVPHVIAARSVFGCRVGLVVQLRQGHTLAGWDHTEVDLIPLVLTGHEGCPGRACQLGTFSPVVIAPCGHVVRWHAVAVVRFAVLLLLLRPASVGGPIRA